MVQTNGTVNSGRFDKSGKRRQPSKVALLSGKFPLVSTVPLVFPPEQPFFFVFFFFFRQMVSVPGYLW